MTWEAGAAFDAAIGMTACVTRLSVHVRDEAALENLFLLVFSAGSLSPTAFCKTTQTPLSMHARTMLLAADGEIALFNAACPSCPRATVLKADVPALTPDPPPGDRTLIYLVSAVLLPAPITRANISASTL